MPGRLPRACLLLLFLAGGCDSTVGHSPGVLIDHEPIQHMFATPRRWEEAGFEFEAVADFDIEARVLHRNLHWLQYWFPAGIFGTRLEMEQLSPLDLALGWGLMSDSSLLDQIDLRQSGRGVIWKPRGKPLPVSNDVIRRNLANVHLVPASAGIRSQLVELRQDDLVRLVGELVNIHHPASGGSWETSTRRDDTGCELLYVRTVARLGLTAPGAAARR